MRILVFLIVLILPINAISDTIIITYKNGRKQIIKLTGKKEEIEKIEFLKNLPEKSIVKKEFKNTKKTNSNPFKKFKKEMEQKLKPSFEGLWNSNFGNIVFKIDGRKVYGIYKNGKGKIIGNLSKNGLVLKGKWMEAPDFKPPRHAGKVILKLSPSGMSFKGLWGFGDEEPDSQWVGRKIK